MKSHVNVTSCIVLTETCKKCKGQYYFPNNQKKTQDTIRKKFGVLPDKCVDFSNGRPRCPFAK